VKPALYALLALSACSHPAPVAPTDQALSRFEHAGDIALAEVDALKARLSSKEISQ